MVVSVYAFLGFCMYMLSVFEDGGVVVLKEASYNPEIIILTHWFDYFYHISTTFSLVP